MVAGEASGDLLAGLLLRRPAGALAGARAPTASAGRRWRRRASSAWWPHDKLAVRGYVEVLRHYREILGIRNALAARLLAEPPDAFIGVDAPDFNLGLEAQLKARGIKTVHFVSPSIWAWRGRRIEQDRRARPTDAVHVPVRAGDLRAAAASPRRYVGHPLADAIPLEPPRAAARAALGLPTTRRSSRCCPAAGARRSQYIAPRLRRRRGAACGAQRPRLRFVAAGRAGPARA